MRKIIVAMQMTLDGFIEGPKGELDWAMAEDEETWSDHFGLMQSVDTILMGRVMYPAYEQYWLAAPTNPSSSKREVEYALLADRMQKIVISKTIEKVEWKSTRIVRDAAEIGNIKHLPGMNMVLLGGATIVSSFLNLGLIDEYHLVVNPIVLGGGKSPFRDVKSRHMLKLIEAKTFNSGKVLLRYDVIN